MVDHPLRQQIHLNRLSQKPGPPQLESIIEAMAEAGATEIAKTLWHRYADFQRILDISLLDFEAGMEHWSSSLDSLGKTTVTDDQTLIA
jgi:hypothetical protein